MPKFNAAVGAGIAAAALAIMIVSGVIPLILREAAGSNEDQIMQSNGTFAPTTSRIIANTSVLEGITHATDAIESKGINPTHVLDWSQDGKYILFQFSDYSKFASWGPADAYSLAIIDLLNGNNIQKLDLEMRNAPSQDYPEGYLLTIFQAKFSSSGDSIFYLVGGNDPENRYPENIYKYNHKTGANQQITNSSNVAWFDIARRTNDTLVYMTHNYNFHFYPQDNPQLSSELHSFLVTNNIQPVTDRFAVSLNGKQFAFPSVDGIKYINLQSGETKTIIPRTCISNVAFSPNAEFLIYSPHLERNCEKGEDYVLRIVSIEGNNESGELVYMDNWGWLDTVISPDGAYLATNAQGSSERMSGHGDENDINPRIVTIQLARPVPEFGNITVVIIGTIMIAMTFATIVYWKFNYHALR